MPPTFFHLSKGASCGGNRITAASPEKHSVNSCSSLVALSKALRACSSVIRLLISLWRVRGADLRVDHPAFYPFQPRIVKLQQVFSYLEHVAKNTIPNVLQGHR